MPRSWSHASKFCRTFSFSLMEHCGVLWLCLKSLGNFLVSSSMCLNPQDTCGWEGLSWYREWSKSSWCSTWNPAYSLSWLAVNNKKYYTSRLANLDVSYFSLGTIDWPGQISPSLLSSKSLPLQVICCYPEHHKLLVFYFSSPEALFWGHWEILQSIFHYKKTGYNRRSYPLKTRRK